MRNLEERLKNRKLQFDKLLEYGFIKKNEEYIYQNKICDNTFEMIVQITLNNKAISKVIDTVNKDEYVLVDISDITGEFVGKIKEEYENKLQDIIEKCTIFDVFKSEQAKQVIQYVKEKYNDELEFLWKKFSNNAVFRNKETKKWYGALLIISKRKLGIEDDTIIEILDLRNTKEEIEKIVDNNKIFPGYHMNKNHWFTIPLDGSVPTKEIFKYIDVSYNIEETIKTIQE